MLDIRKTDLPPEALLQSYAAMEGCYTDCFYVDVARTLAMPDFVFAFYTTWLFKVERVILERFADRPSTDQQAFEVGEGKRDDFAAWNVEARNENQLLMCDHWGKTRSWFMTRPGSSGDGGQTRLYFGSAVVPVPSANNEPPAIGSTHRALLGFHKLYSRALLSAASARLRGAPATEFLRA